MSAFVLTNCKAYFAGVDATGFSNELSMKLSGEDKEVTTFASGGNKERLLGLRDVEASMKGFWDISLDTVGFTNMPTMDRVATVSASGAEAESCWIFQGSNFSWSRFDAVGEVDPFELSLQGTNTFGAVMGQLAKAKGTVSATGAMGSVLNLGAPSATQFVYATLHVFGTPGTTITVQVQSDDNAGMTTPTTRGTIGPITTSTGVWMTRVAGPFSGETYWRMNVSAITGTFSVAGAIGIA